MILVVQKHVVDEKKRDVAAFVDTAALKLDRVEEVEICQILSSIDHTERKNEKVNEDQVTLESNDRMVTWSVIDVENEDDDLDCAVRIQREIVP